MNTLGKFASATVGLAAAAGMITIAQPSFAANPVAVATAVPGNARGIAHAVPMADVAVAGTGVTQPDRVVPVEAVTLPDRAAPVAAAKTQPDRVATKPTSTKVAAAPARVATAKRQTSVVAPPPMAPAVKSTVGIAFAV